jgi:hypothetical protein
MEVRRQVDGDHRIPFVVGKFVDRGDVLDAGVVHQDVHPAELRHGMGDQLAHFGRLREIGAVIADPHLVLRRQLFAERLNGRLVAETVQHHIRARTRKRARDAEADAAGRAGDDGHLSFQCRHQAISSGTFSK